MIDDAQVTPLFLFDKKSILQNDDLFYLNKLIDFHARVFDKSNIASETVIQFFEKQTEYLFQLYDKVDLLSINELTQFFANFSYYSQGHFQVLSTRYKILTPALLASAGDSKAMLFLSNVNPRVLTQFAKQLSEIHISNTSLPLLLSLISDETTFDLAKTTITMTAIKLLTFENSLILLHQLSQYNYSVKFLTEQLPNAIDEYLLDLNPDETNLARKNFKLNQVKLATLKSIYLHLNDNHPFKERVGVQIKILESGAIYSDNSVQAIVQSSTA